MDLEFPKETLSWRLLLILSLFILSFFAKTIYSRLYLILNGFLSTTVNFFLMRQYPIHHNATRDPLPTCPYTFPNGQGNIAKFPSGLSNSTLWSQQHGSVYRIWCGTKPEIVLTRAAHVKAVFRDSDRHTKAVNNNSGYFMQQLLGQCLGLISGAEWADVKDVVHAPFARAAMEGYEGFVVQEVESFFARAYEGKKEKRIAADGKSEGDLVRLDPIADVKMLPFFIIARILYGELTPDVEAQLQQLAVEREALFHHVIQGGITRFHLSRLLPTKANRELGAFKHKWRAFNMSVVRQCSGQQSEKQPVPPIVPMYAEVERGRITEEQLLQTLDEILFANLDVTMGAVGWTLVFLATHSRLQEKIRTEMHEWPQQRRQEGGSGTHKYLLSTSTLLHASILEAARLKPLAAFSVPQAAPTERVVDGYAIPRRTDFVIDSHLLNWDVEFWGKDADVYRPERFLEKKGTELRYHYWRFGFGPRQCLGKYVADLMLHVLVAQMVENYRLENETEREKWTRIEKTWISHPKLDLKWERR